MNIKNVGMKLVWYESILYKSKAVLFEQQACY